MYVLYAYTEYREEILRMGNNRSYVFSKREIMIVIGVSMSTFWCHYLMFPGNITTSRNSFVVHYVFSIIVGIEWNPKANFNYPSIVRNLLSFVIQGLLLLLYCKSSPLLTFMKKVIELFVSYKSSGCGYGYKICRNRLLGSSVKMKSIPNLMHKALSV